MTVERTVKLEDLRERDLYKDSPLICNLTLNEEKSSGHSSCHSMGFTKKEAEQLHEKLGKLLSK